MAITTQSSWCSVELMEKLRRDGQTLDIQVGARRLDAFINEVRDFSRPPSLREIENPKTLGELLQETKMFWQRMVKIQVAIDKGDGGQAEETICREARVFHAMMRQICLYLYEHAHHLNGKLAVDEGTQIFAADLLSKVTIRFSEIALIWPALTDPKIAWDKDSAQGAWNHMDSFMDILAEMLAQINLRRPPPLTS